MTDPGSGEWLQQRAADIELRDEARAVMTSRNATWRLRIKAFGVWLVFRRRVRKGEHGDPPRWLSLAWHGNHCGPGHGVESAPAVDALDAACVEHDDAYRDG